jgi:transcriptional repressor NrdR
MDRLRALDQIAYIRFASVYQSYEDIEQLKREVDTLLAERATPGETGAAAAAAPSKRG